MSKKADKESQAQMDFNIQLFPGAIKSGMAGVGAIKRDVYQVEPHILKVLPNFNVRVRNEEYFAHIRNLADSMKAEGFFQHKPLAGIVVREGDEESVYVYEGHSRLEAALLAIKEGAGLERVPVIVQSGVSLEDMTVALVRANSGKPLSPYEVGVVCKRMVNFGYDEPEIATKLGYTPQYVRDLLMLMATPDEYRKLVRDGVVSAGLAIDMLAQHGARALEKLLEAQRRAQEGGKSRVTNKHVAPNHAFNKKVKKHSADLYGVMSKVRQDSAYVSLSEEVREQLEQIFTLLAEGGIEGGAA